MVRDVAASPISWQAEVQQNGGRSEFQSGYVQAMTADEKSAVFVVMQGVRSDPQAARVVSSCQPRGV